MDRWRGKVAIVTGASSGIGASVAETLARQGLRVVALARRLDKLQQLSANLKGAKGRIEPIQCDVTKEEDILRAFEWTEKELGSIDVLVNNAGVVATEPIIDGSTENFRKIINVNVIGVAICTREAVRRMRKQSTQGHIFNINSIAGHYGGQINFPVSLYTASKYAVTGMCLSLRYELSNAKVNVKITSISPGAVRTPMIDQPNLPAHMKDPSTNILNDTDISSAIIYALSLPPHAEVNELIITPIQTKTSASK